ncbi:MAG: sensor histidine kinase [Limnohabitans sp.]
MLNQSPLVTPTRPGSFSNANAELFKILLRFLTLLFFIFVSLGARAANEPVLRDLAVYTDKAGTESIDSIAAVNAVQFKPLPGNSFAAGYTRSVHWLRFTVDAPVGEWWLDIEPPFLDDLRLYEPDPSEPGGFTEHRAGKTLPFAAREVDSRSFVFKLRLNDATPRTYYLRLRTDSSSIILPRLWAPQDFYARASLETGLLMAILAVVVTVILLNINAWFWLREPISLWFTAYLVSLVINFFSTSGFLQQYLLPKQPAVVNHVIGLSVLCTIAFGHVFFQHLFMVQPTQRWLYRMYRIAFWSPLLASASLPLGYYPEVMTVMSSLLLLMNLVGIGLTFRLWRKNISGGSMMFASNLISMAGIFVFFLNLKGLISGGFVVLYSLQIASLGSIIALQLSVASRYRTMRDERLQEQTAAQLATHEASRERAIRMQQEHFLAMLTHELKTPLSVARISLSASKLVGPQRTRIERALSNINAIVDRCCIAGQIDHQQLEPHVESCELMALVDECIAACNDPDAVKVLERNSARIQTDSQLLTICLANLIDNALKYSPSLSPVTIRVQPKKAAVGESAGGVVVSVGNRVGPAGVPDAARIFSKYYRSPGAMSKSGSGLGLYLTHSIAQLLGAQLSYRVDGEQVEFSLWLPA